MPSRTERTTLAVAAALFATVILDMAYGVYRGREALITWSDLIMTALALFVLLSDRISEFVVTATGITIRQQVEAAARLGAAQARSEALNPSDLSSRGAAVQRPAPQARVSNVPRVESSPLSARPFSPPSPALLDDADASQIADAITRLSTQLGPELWRNRTILWVDPNPDAHRDELQMFEALGVRCLWATSLEQARATLAREPVDLVIRALPLAQQSAAADTQKEPLAPRDEKTSVITYGPVLPGLHEASKLHATRPLDLLQAVADKFQSEG